MLFINTKNADITWNYFHCLEYSNYDLWRFSSHLSLHLSFFYRKYEEIYPPDVGEFVYITDDTYTKKQVLRMEHLILKVLNFDVAVPTSVDFLKRYLKSADADKKTEYLAFVRMLCRKRMIVDIK